VKNQCARVDDLTNEDDVDRMNPDELRRLVRKLRNEQCGPFNTKNPFESDLEFELDTTKRLQRLSVSLIEAENILGLYDQILEEAKAILRSDFATIQMFHPERGEKGELQLIGYRGFTDEAAKKWEWVTPSTKSSCGMALRSRQREMSSDVLACAFLADSYADTGIRALQTTPLISRSGALVGMLSTHWRTPHALTEGETRSLDVLARLAADLIERKQAEDALDALTRELEQRVRERTAELERANRAKDEFLANMSHEIRTPMAGVIGLTEILLLQDLPAKVRTDLEMISSSAESVMMLINDLFDLSRIQQGKFDFHPEVFDLPAMIRNTTGPFEFQAQSKELDFVVSIDGGVPGHVLCDKERLGQVIKNLVSNAIKFTKKGFVRIDVRSEEQDADTLRLLVSVSDSGIGIPRDRQKDVFSAFTQLDSSVSKKFAGMGLGLAISRSLVEGMGGEIQVRSAKGKGSTFSFSIRCTKVTEQLETAQQAISLSDLPPMTILLAEDNPVNRLFLRRALVTAGHKVGEAEDGGHAIAKLGDTHFDLILMDIQMPEMDGIEATLRIRSGKVAGANPRIPIIALTAYAMKGDREKFLGTGMDGYVIKPVDFGELARTIADVSGTSPVNAPK
jgi:signal transduction histidine kinase/ActR/RegA family two-component response regulator